MAVLAPARALNGNASLGVWGRWERPACAGTVYVKSYKECFDCYWSAKFQTPVDVAVTLFLSSSNDRQPLE